MVVKEVIMKDELYPFKVKVHKNDNPDVVKTYKIQNEEDIAKMLEEVKENNDGNG
jgi:hypothetical protein